MGFTRLGRMDAAGRRKVCHASWTFCHHLGTRGKTSMQFYLPCENATQTCSRHMINLHTTHKDVLLEVQLQGPCCNHVQKRQFVCLPFLSSALAKIGGIPHVQCCCKNVHVIIMDTYGASIQQQQHTTSHETRACVMSKQCKNVLLRKTTENIHKQTNSAMDWVVANPWQRFPFKS